MIIQRLIIDAEEDRKSLYVRTNGLLKGGTAILAKSQYISFDTYINFFSAYKWKKYTIVDNLYVNIKYKGHCIVRLYMIEDNMNDYMIKEEKLISSSETVYKFGDFSINDLGNACYIAIEALEESSIYEIAFCATVKKVNKVSIACGICTYKREKELKKNIDELFSSVIDNQESVLYNHLDVYVADNGHTLNDYGLVKDGHIKIYENKNYGGSAGFTRCMIEAKFNSGKEYSHMLLIDDDAEIRGFVIERLAILLMVIREEYKDYLIGGSLMALEMPTLLMEQGGLYTHDKIFLRKQFIDVSLKSNIVLSEEELDVNYNAWFFSCFPINIIREDNLPLPFFIHGDDIEYGLQFNKRIIHMNGVCIWHPNPLIRGGQRDYMSYYDSRNFMIINSAYYPKETVCKLKSFMLIKVLGSALMFKYDKAFYILRGYDDFSRGIEWLKQQDAEKLNQEIMQSRTPTEKYYLNESEKVKVLTDQNRKLWYIKTVFNWLIPSWKCNNYSEDVWKNTINYFGVKEIRIINLESKEGIVLKKDYKRLVEVLKELFRVAKKLNRRTVQQYGVEKINSIKSFEFWKDYLEI